MFLVSFLVYFSCKFLYANSVDAVQTPRSLLSWVYTICQRPIYESINHRHLSQWQCVASHIWNRSVPLIGLTVRKKCVFLTAAFNVEM